MTTAAEYDPLTGENWDQAAATAAWSASMSQVQGERSSARWQLRGRPGTWHWVFFDFRSWTGQVKIGPDGFQWETASYDTGNMIHSGLTTSLYEAFQSVERNEVVRRPAENL